MSEASTPRGLSNRTLPRYDFSRKSSHPLLWLNFPRRVKVYSNECLPWSEVPVQFENRSLNRYAYLRQVCIDGRS